MNLKTFLIIWISISLSLTLNCKKSQNLPGTDFSTPTKTIQTYYENYNNKEIKGSCFEPKGWGGGLTKIWLKDTINEPVKTKMTGDTLYGGIKVNENAVEVIVDVQMDNPEKGNPTTKFWYLLQQYDKEWKIISLSHIPDKNYPPLD